MVENNIVSFSIDNLSYQNYVGGLWFSIRIFYFPFSSVKKKINEKNKSNKNLSVLVIHY